MYTFVKYHEKLISIQGPFVCELLGLINYQAKTKIATCSVKDDSGAIIIGFVYNKFAELLNDHHVQNRMPFKISVISGKIMKKGNDFTFEIYQCIYEKDFLINSSSLAGHSYCEMSTYLNTHVNAFSPFNSAQIFGIIYHDYLMYVFEDSELLKLPIGDPQIKKKVKTAFQRAIYQNWKSLVAFNINEDAYLEYFLSYYVKREVEFINFELTKLRNYGDDYSFQAEVMTRSRIIGLQGRVDRILWNQSRHRFTIYETKTGRSSYSAENTAKYQLMAYSLILQEYYTNELEELLLEYPRLDIEDRLKIIEFDERELIRLVNMRNQIWAISIGRRPGEGPFKQCSTKCFQKSACSFYCLRSFLTNHCMDCERCNYHPILFDKTEFEEFRRINVYYDWYYQFLEMEYLNNQDLLLELGIPAKEREALGNCFSDVIISSIEKKLENQDNTKLASSARFWIKFTHKDDLNSLSFENTRINSSDYVLITPQNYRPLTLQSIPGTIYEIQSKYVVVEVSSAYHSVVSDFIQQESFRIDIFTSNQIINREKSALDAFMRKPYFLGNTNLKRIRKYLLKLNNEDTPLKISTPNSIEKKLVQKGYNPNQIKAIISALSFEGLLLIQGPPGSGKTTVVTEIVHQLVKKLNNKPNSTKRHPVEDKPKTVGKKNEKDIPEFDFENLISTKKILLTAYTNRAVDTLVEMLITKYPNINILRIGSKLSISEPVQLHTLDHQSKKNVKFSDGHSREINSSKLAHQLIQDATVIATTCLGAESVLLQNAEFEYVVIDEAGQVVEPAALIPLLKAKNIILVGDDAQLPPISVKEQNPLLNSDYFSDKNYLRGFKGTILQYQRDKDNTEDFLDTRKEIFFKELRELGIFPSDTLSTSLFQRLKRVQRDKNRFILLTEQYRMHKSINDFISKQFYESKLIPGIVDDESIGNRLLVEFYNTYSIEIPLAPSQPKSMNDLCTYALHPETPMIFLDTHKLGSYDSKLDENFDEMTSKFNLIEAKIIAKIIHHLIGLKSKQSPNENEIQHFLSNIGVITPYRAQVRQIRSKIREVMLKDEKWNNLISKYLLVDTVDKFQGKESEIILISLVDSTPSGKLGTLYSELRRMNVSITRAKTKLILIGDSDMFTRQEKDTSEGSKTILDFFTGNETELSNDSNFKGTTLKKTEKIYRFFTDLVNYIRNQQGLVILDENMIKSEEQ